MRVRFQWVTNAASVPPVSADNDYFGAGIDNLRLMILDAGAGSYEFMQGTSMATPYVTGLAALLKSYQPTFTYLGLKNTILNNVDAKPGLSGKVVTGGRINANNSLTNVDAVAPTATINYSTTAATNQNVTATLAPSEPIVVTNNGSSTSYTFTTNGSFAYTFTDLAGNPGAATATVSNIDKVAPTITVAPFSTTPTNQDVTVTATTDEGTLNAGSHTFTANGSFDFVATDAAGNVTSVTVTITNIDKTFHPVVKTIKLTKGAYVSVVGNKKNTIRPFAATYLGKVWARKVDFGPSASPVYLFASLGPFPKGAIKAYDQNGKLLGQYKPSNAILKNGMVLDIAVQPDHRVHLAAGTPNEGTTVRIYRITTKGLSTVSTVTAVKTGGQIVVKFSKIYGSEYGLLTYLKGKKSTLKVWKYNSATGKFAEDKQYNKGTIKITSTPQNAAVDTRQLIRQFFGA